MIISLVMSLIFTLIIELFISFLLGVRNKKDIIVVICANVCTNPVIVHISNCIIYFCSKIVYNNVIIGLEVLAVIVEAVIYKKCLSFGKSQNCYIFSLINNIMSFSIRIGIK